MLRSILDRIFSDRRTIRRRKLERKAAFRNALRFESLEARSMLACVDGFNCVDLLNKGQLSQGVEDVVGTLCYKFDGNLLTIRTSVTGATSSNDAGEQLGLDDDTNPWSLDEGILGNNGYIEISGATLAPLAGDQEETESIDPPGPVTEKWFYEVRITGTQLTPTLVAGGDTPLDFSDDVTEYTVYVADFQYISFHFNADVGGDDTSILGFIDREVDDCIDVDQTVVVSGFKYEDVNGNGVQDVGDPGLPNWHFTVWVDSDGDDVHDVAEVHDVVTNAFGSFIYTEEVPDSILAGAIAYEVQEVLPDTTWVPTEGALGYSGTLTTIEPEAANLAFGNFKQITISGVKYYDADTDGVRDAVIDEPAISGWTINVLADADGNGIQNGTETITSVVTDITGAYTFNLGPLPGGQYIVTEGTGLTGTWIQTSDDPAPIVPTSGAVTGQIDFGNVKLGAGGGLTLGFWSNKNGQKRMETGTGGMTGALAALNALNLVDADGSPAGNDLTGFGNYAEFRTWLLNGNATNMAYMLSVQLAAMQLNVRNGFVSGSSLVYDGNGFVTVNSLITQANAALLADGQTLADDPNRAAQEALKNTIDNANNNQNFVITLSAWHDDDNDGVIDAGEI